MNKIRICSFFILKIIDDVFPLENLLFVTNVKNRRFVTYMSLQILKGKGRMGEPPIYPFSAILNLKKCNLVTVTMLLRAKKKMIGKKFLNQV